MLPSPNGRGGGGEGEKHLPQPLLIGGVQIQSVDYFGEGIANSAIIFNSRRIKCTPPPLGEGLGKRGNTSPNLS